MARDWEAQFRQWAKPPGKTEQDRCNNAASAIRNAINASDKLRNRGVSIFASQNSISEAPAHTNSVPSGLKVTLYTLGFSGRVKVSSTLKLGTFQIFRSARSSLSGPIPGRFPDVPTPRRTRSDEKARLVIGPECSRLFRRVPLSLSRSPHLL